MNQIDWFSIFYRGVLGILFGPPVAWGLWLGWDKLHRYFHPLGGESATLAIFDFFGGTLGSIFAGLILGPIVLISWGLWGDSFLAVVASRLSRQPRRGKKRKYARKRLPQHPI